MYSPPFARKFLPWLYTGLFLVAAPALIFYTAGYRYNLKKAAIEKHGTLIADSVPGDAEIFLDGADTGETTPNTFQELTPGWHRVRYEKDGFSPWEKTLEVRPERVTFADHALLWRAEPDIRLALQEPVSILASNPEQDTLAALGPGAAPSTTRLLLVHAKARLSLDAALPIPFEPSVPRWQADGRALLLDGEQDRLVRLSGRTATATSTASGLWDGTDFLTFSSTTLGRWSSRTGVFADEALATSVHERIGDFALESGRQGTQLLFDKTFTSKAFSLPAGDWHFGDLADTTILLRDGDRWLGVNPRHDEPFVGQLEGDAPRWLADASPARALFLHGNELWLWGIGSPPELLARQSEPLREAAWHASGDAVFFADGHSLDVIELDGRDGRARHTLATFDDLRDFDVIGKVLYVAGTRDGQSGLWSVTIE